MTVRVSVRTDLRRMERLLSDRLLRQLPFAAAAALTDTAKAAKVDVTAALPSIFDRPTPFTMNALAIKSASKSDLRAVVLLKPIQAKYLLHEEIGGIRTAAENTRKPAAALIVPGAIKRDAYGNIPAGFLAKLRAQPTKGLLAEIPVFYAKGVGPLGGPGGFFQRLPGDRLQRLTAFEASAHYKPIFHFRDRVLIVVRRRFTSFLRQRLRQAIASAR